MGAWRADCIIPGMEKFTPFRIAQWPGVPVQPAVLQEKSDQNSPKFQSVRQRFNPNVVGFGIANFAADGEDKKIADLPAQKGEYSKKPEEPK